jgi:hypothetical protein
VKSPGSSARSGKSSPGRGLPAGTGKKKPSSNANSKQAPVSDAALRRQYTADARYQQAAAARDTKDAAHRRAEAARYEAKAKKAQQEGYGATAAYDRAKAARELAAGRKDAAKARTHEVRAKRDKLKAARVGLAGPGSWLHRQDVCAAVAVAGSLALAGGVMLSDGDVWALHLRGGGSVLGALEVASGLGLADIGLASVDGIGKPGENGCGHAGFGCGEVLGAMRAEDLDDLPVGARDSPQFTEGGRVNDRLVAAQQLHDTRSGHAGSLVPGFVLRALGAANLQVSGLNVGCCVPDPNVAWILELALTGAQRDQRTWDVEEAPPWGPHAVVLAGDTVLSWGREIRVTQAFLEHQVTRAWLVG